MKTKSAPLSLVLLLCLLALVGAAANLLVFLDTPWIRWIFVHEGTAQEIEDEEDAAEVPSDLRQSIFLVALARCDNQGQTSGTGFVVAPGYVITCAHVVGDNLACGSEIRVIGAGGASQPAVLEGFSDVDDLAVLKVTDTSAPPLPLAESSQFEDTDQVLRVYTAGYPLIGAASSPEKASLSGIGTVSQYDPERDVFITSGLNVNPGNSGGPVLFEDERMVLGVASARLDSSIAEGIGYVIPSEAVKEFFFEKTGRELE